jgi:hypothetical protein
MLGINQERKLFSQHQEEVKDWCKQIEQSKDSLVGTELITSGYDHFFKTLGYAPGSSRTPAHWWTYSDEMIKTVPVYRDNPEVGAVLQEYFPEFETVNIGVFAVFLKDSPYHKNADSGDILIRSRDYPQHRADLGVWRSLPKEERQIELVYPASTTIVNGRIKKLKNINLQDVNERGLLVLANRLALIYAENSLVINA